MNADRSKRYEVTLAHGLEQVAAQELRQKLGKGIRFVGQVEDEVDAGALQFTYGGDPARLLQLTTISNAFAISAHDIPRPKALCDPQHLSPLIARIKRVLRLYPHGTPRNFGISAAGDETGVMQRLSRLLEQGLGLPFAADEVDLLLRFRPARLQSKGWEVLIRLSPRPLSVRAWRKADMKGALLAPVASCMVRLTRPKPADSFLNIGCGSGTLLIERLIDGPARRAIGCDISVDALADARTNLAASQLQPYVELHNWDARALNLPDASIDAICADLPYGIAVGSHADNVTLYPALLNEAARVAKPRSRYVLITQEARLTSALVDESTLWKQLDDLRISLRGLHPRIFVLERTTQS